MVGIDNVELQQVIVHKVGNPTRGESLKLSKNKLTLNDDIVNKIFVKYLLNGFNENDLYHFTHLSDLAMNEVYNYVQQCFKSDGVFEANSALMAQFLYSKSTHVKVKEGEMYVVKFDKVPFEGDFIEAFGIFKNESKETYLRVMEHGQTFEIIGEDGINLSKIDKGCLVFNKNGAEGYYCCIIDKGNKDNDTAYWVKDFLGVEPVANEYHFTNEYLQVVKQFATQEMPEHFEVTKGQQIDLMQRGLDYFKENEEFVLDDFTEQVIQYPEMIEQFATFKDNYAQSKNIEMENEFGIDLSAVKKQSKSFKSVLKLDKNFHIYIHGRRDLLERGYDEESGKFFYKIYFEEES